MRVSGIAVAVVALHFLSGLVWRAQGQSQPPSDRLLITTDTASTWNDGSTIVFVAQTPVTIETQDAVLSARSAVVWITPLAGSVLDQNSVQIALLGDAKVVQTRDSVIRSGEQILVSLTVRGSIRTTTETRNSRNLSDSELYRQALAIRPGERGAAPGVSLIQRPWLTPPVSAPPTTQPAPRPRPAEPVTFRAADVQTTQTADNKVAFVLSGGVVLLQHRAGGDFIELQADRAVVFTQLSSLRALGSRMEYATAEDAVQAAYLEGDVRIVYTPDRPGRGDQRLSADRVYYEFTTDRAILTQAVIHTVEPDRQIPLMVRAESIRQLSVGEYRTEKVELSTSQFATPSYSIKADRAYVRQEETGDPRYGTRTSYTARDATIDLFGLPVFYTPVVSGALTDRGSALRSLYFEDSNRFGPSVRSEWGLFESLGVLPPEDLDITYKLEYLGDRGPAGGIGATYQGGYITETTRQAWDFQGRMDSYIIDDHGTDDLGKDRLKVEPPDQIRGKILWEHQHFFPGDWQAQVRMGYLSDPTFLEEYFEREFDQSQQYEAAAYLKRQRDTEALTLLITFQPNGFPTVSNQLQEQAAVERYPEIGYHRIGDSIGDSLTLFSDNTFAALQFRTSDATLAEEGFAPGQSPGIPSYAQTGTTESTTFRADFREEIDWPLALGRFKVVPYVVGRYTPYSDSPDGGSENRFLVAAGLRVATAFWRVDDTAESNLFDIHRVRHVIEPEMNLFTSYSTVDRDDLFIYDENVDAINDISAAQFAIRQRWQTKRGGAGNFRSVDFFTLNVELNLFANQPSESDLNPAGFRGLFFFSDPEASIPRNSLNADALWRVSDTTAILSDVQYNLDQFELATTSIGLAVQRDPRVSYFIGARYIGQINSTLGNFAVDYELSPKYAILFAQSFNFSEEQNQDTRVTVIRKFDHFALTFTYFYDAVEDDSGFRFGLIPEGMGSGYNTGQLQSLFVQ